VRSAVLLFASALVLTLAMAAPVLQAPSERIFGREIVGRHHDAYTMVRLFEQPAWHPFTQPVTDWTGAAIAHWLGGVRAYNILVLASFPLAALFAFLLARHFALPRWAAAAVGLAFAFSPSHLAHGAYHPHVAQIQWIPLYLLALVRCLERWTPSRAFQLLVAGALLVLSNFYGGLFAALLAPPALIFYRPDGFDGRRRNDWLPTALTLTAGGAAGWVYLRLTAGDLAALAGNFAFPPADLWRYSARWYSYLLPPVDHPLVGGRLWSFWGERGVADGLLEQQLTLGLALLALALFAVVAWWRAPARLPGGRGVPFFLALGLAAFSASLAPAPMAGPWPAPAIPAMLHPVLPMFRAYARLGVFVQLMVALLAAVGAATLARRGTGPRLVAASLLLLAVVELAPFPPWRWHDVLPTEGHRWMAGLPAPWRLLDCAEEPPQVARSIVEFLPQPASLLSPGVADCAEPGLPAKLAALEYSHLLLRHGSAEESWLAARELPVGLTEAARFEDSRLLRVEAAPAVVYLDRWHGFSWREYAGGLTFRWLGPSGEWDLVNTGQRPLAARLEVELWSFAAARDLVVTLNGETAAALRVTQDPGRYELGRLRLGPGRHRLGWRPLGEPAVPDEILGNGDLRPLTIAVGSWRWLPEPLSARAVGGGR
jgi:hypothetical protein